MFNTLDVDKAEERQRAIAREILPIITLIVEEFKARSGGSIEVDDLSSDARQYLRRHGFFISPIKKQVGCENDVDPWVPCTCEKCSTRQGMNKWEISWRRVITSPVVNEK